MHSDKKSNGWILCPSKTFPGKFYYFNVLNGEVAWSLNEKDQKMLMEEIQLKEPSSPPTEEETTTIFNPVENIMFRKPEFPNQLAPRHFISDTTHPTFGQTEYPNCISNFGPYMPNVIWAPIQRPSISQPIYVQIPPEVKKEVSEDTSWRPKSTVNMEKNLLIHTSTMPLNKRFSNIKRTIVNDMHSSYGNNIQHINNNLSSTLVTNAWGLPMFDQSHEMKPDNQSENNNVWNRKYSASIIREPVFKGPNLEFTSTRNDVSVTFRDLPERSEASYKNSDIPFQKSFQTYDTQSQKSDTQIQKSHIHCQKSDKQCQVSDIETITLDIQATSKSIGDLRIDDQPKKLAENDLRLRLLARKRKAEYDKSDKDLEIKNKYIPPRKQATFNLSHSGKDFKDDFIIEDVNKRPKLLTASQKEDKSIVALKNLSRPKVNTVHWYIVVDAEGLLQEFEFIEIYIQKDPKCRLFVPYVVKFEIEAMCLSDSKRKNNVSAARQITLRLRSPSNFIVVQNKPTEGSNCFSKNEAILDCCKDLIDQNFHVVLITDSDYLQKAAKGHLPWCSLKEIKGTTKVSKQTTFGSCENQNFQKSLDNNNIQRNNDLFIINGKETQSLNFRDENKFKKSFFTTDTTENNPTVDKDISPKNNNFENKMLNQNIFLNNNSNHLVITKQDENEIPKSNLNPNKSEHFFRQVPKDHDISETKLGKLRAAVLDLRNDILEKSNHSTAEHMASCKVDSNEISTDKDVFFSIKNDVMEDQIKKRIEEWICLFTQIMEDVLSIVIQNHCDPLTADLPPPWTFHEAILCVNKIFVHNDVIRGETEKLSMLLFDFSCKKGKLRSSDMKPQDLMKIIKCSINLIRNLKDIIANCKALSDAEDSILEMVNNMERPITNDDNPRTHKVLETSATNEDETRSLPEQSFISKHSEILKHHPVWKSFECGKKYEEEVMASQGVQDNLKIIRTVGGNLNMLKINQKKTMQLHDFNVTETNNADSSENDLNVPVHGNTFSCKDDESNKPKVTRNIRILPAFENKLLGETVQKLNSKVFDFSESISSASNMGSQNISYSNNKKMFRNFSKITYCDEARNAINNNYMENNTYNIDNHANNRNSCNTVERGSFCKDSEKTADIDLIFGGNKKKTDEPNASLNNNFISNNLKRKYYQTASNIASDSYTFENIKMNVFSNTDCDNVESSDYNQSRTENPYNYNTNNEDKSKRVHFVQETNDGMDTNINNEPKVIRKIQLIKNYELGTPFYFSDISTDTISNEVETAFKKQTIFDEKSSSCVQRKSENNASKTTYCKENTYLNDCSNCSKYNNDNRDIGVFMRNNDEIVKKNDDYAKNNNSYAFLNSQGAAILKTNPTNESINDKVENENLQAYALVRTFLVELSGIFKVIYKFIEESTKQCRRKNVETDEKQQIHKAATMTQLYVLEIMVKLKSIIQRESIEETSAKSMILKCGFPASEDKRITRYLQVITKCLEQAEILEKGLKILSEVTKEDFNIFSIKSCFDIGDVKYFNIFE